MEDDFMAHLLMIDSWVGGNGVILPRLLKELGHTYTFVTRNRAHYHSDFRVEEHAVIQFWRQIPMTPMRSWRHFRIKIMTGLLRPAIIISKLSPKLRSGCNFPARSLKRSKLSGISKK